jgi:hypothetical protein
MATKRKPVKKRSPVRKVPPPDVIQMPDWTRVTYGDLHVKAPTLVRCIQVLRRVRKEAIRLGCPVVCTGDFWDQRGILSVRQLDELYDELDEWERAGIEKILIPGNHDQVTRDGMIHGLRVFAKYDNIRVVTELEIDEKNKIAYVPWREDPAAQEEMFKAIPQGYVAFGHGEITGAVANNGHKSAGKFSNKSVKHLKAVYLGHYHKRQQLANVFYLGSPYEQDMGERNMPHGIGVVRSSEFEPAYINFDEFPKHWRFTWPNDESVLSAPREQDIVEVLAPKQELRSPAFLEALDSIAAKDVRPMPLATNATRGAPAFAVKLEEAIDRYIEEYDKLPEALSPDRLRGLGHTLLGGVADKGTIAPLGNTLHIDEVEVQGFCAVRDRQVIPLRELGTCLLRGPMGSGKTALSDATTWCLFGLTAPRKPGAAGATIKADKVIYDSADVAYVAVRLRIDDDPTEYRIERSKQRGKGQKVTITAAGKDFHKEGIADTQDLIHHLIGVDYDLWRTCVSLGQGEVSNFVTDAQQKRTELLERAFQLGACPHVVKLTRTKLKALRGKMAEPRERLIGLRAQIQQLSGINYSQESSAWEANRTVRLGSQRDIIDAAKVDIAAHDKHLTHEAGWRDRHDKLVTRAARIRDGLTKSDPQPRIGHLHAQLGSVQAELAAARHNREALGEKYRALQAGEAKVCSECGQTIPLESVEDHLTELETAMRTADTTISSKEMSASNLQTQLGQVTIDGPPDLSNIKTQLEEVEKGMAEASAALEALGQIRVKRQHASDAWEQANQATTAIKVEVNPWTAKQVEQETQLRTLRESEATLRTALEAQEREEAELVFWEAGFGPKGLPILVLRTALYELEMYANQFLSRIMGGRVFTELSMLEDNLDIKFFEYNEEGEVKERDYLSLSGGQRRCVQLAFVPFALSEMVFNRTGVRVPFLVIDELTTHLDPETKPIVCAVLRDLDRETVLVIDHDPHVQGEFDVVYDVSRGGKIRRAA